MTASESRNELLCCVEIRRNHRAHGRLRRAVLVVALVSWRARLARFSNGAVEVVACAAGQGPRALAIVVTRARLARIITGLEGAFRLCPDG